MSVFSIQTGNVQGAIEAIDKITVSVRNGRHFILHQGNSKHSFTMKEMIRAVDQFSKNGEDVSVLRRKLILLELTGKAKLANASLLTRIHAFFRKLFGNGSLNQDLHLDKLDALSSFTLSYKYKLILATFTNECDNMKSTDSKGYKIITDALLTRAELGFVKNLSCDPNTAIGKKRKALIDNLVKKMNNLESQMKTVITPPSDTTNFSEFTQIDDLEIQLQMVKELSKKHPILAISLFMSILKANDIEKFIELASQIKSFRPFLLGWMKAAEAY